MSATISETQQCQQQQNAAMMARNIPSQPLQVYLDARSVNTRYTLMPAIDPYPAATLMAPPIIQRSVYDVHNTFNPGCRGPWSGFAANVNVESELRNQIYALQRCPLTAQTAASNSELFISKQFPHVGTGSSTVNAPSSVNASRVPMQPSSRKYPKIDGYSIFHVSSRMTADPRSQIPGAKNTD